jgi:hypothetical protein
LRELNANRAEGELIDEGEALEGLDSWLLVSLSDDDRAMLASRDVPFVLRTLADRFTQLKTFVGIAARVLALSASEASVERAISAQRRANAPHRMRNSVATGPLHGRESSHAAEDKLESQRKRIEFG